MRDELRQRLARALGRTAGVEGPLLVVLLAVAAVPELVGAVAPWQRVLALVVAVAGVGVAWRFRRGRLFHGILVLAAAGAAARLAPGSTAAELAAVLVPVNLALLAVLPDRGIGTRGGMVRLAVLTGQGLWVAWLAVTSPPGPAVAPLLRLELPLVAVPLGSIGLAYAVALAVLVGATMARGGPVVRGLLWATVAALAAQLGPAELTAYLLTAGGLVLVVAGLEEAHTLAFRDALTGLPSRRELDELLARTAGPFTVAMVDIDHFKAFNDKHGHDVGDQVLRMVAAQLARTGGGARAFRYGGEEFTLVFRGRTLKEAKPYIEEMRQRIAAAEFGVRSPDRPRRGSRKAKRSRGRGAKKVLSVTVSAGAAERKDRSRSPGSVLEAADRALYRAKRAGRNRVMA